LAMKSRPSETEVIVPGLAGGALDVGAAAATELVGAIGFGEGVPELPEQPASVRLAATTAAPIHAARCRSGIDFVPSCNGFVWYMAPTPCKSGWGLSRVTVVLLYLIRSRWQSA